MTRAVSSDSNGDDVYYTTEQAELNPASGSSGEQVSK
jgi:hypothetical protein